ncbi:MAG: hypothetical protein IIC01_04755 [Planctomycetes bacterium]|nr:hypothetical protein [Planctomycetota bacterium]
MSVAPFVGPTSIGVADGVADGTADGAADADPQLSYRQRVAGIRRKRSPGMDEKAAIPILGPTPPWLKLLSATTRVTIHG